MLIDNFLKILPSPCPSSSIHSCFPEVHMLADNTALQGCWWPWISDPLLQPDRQQHVWHYFCPIYTSKLANFHISVITFSLDWPCSISRLTSACLFFSLRLSSSLWRSESSLLAICNTCKNPKLFTHLREIVCQISICASLTSFFMLWSCFMLCSCRWLCSTSSSRCHKRCSSSWWVMDRVSWRRMMGITKDSELFSR